MAQRVEGWQYTQPLKMLAKYGFSPSVYQDDGADELVIHYVDPGYGGLMITIEANGRLSMYFFHIEINTGSHTYRKFDGWTPDAFDLASIWLEDMREHRANRAHRRADEVHQKQLQEKSQPPPPPEDNFSALLTTFKDKYGLEPSVTTHANDDKHIHYDGPKEKQLHMTLRTDDTGAIFFIGGDEYESSSYEFTNGFRGRTFAEFHSRLEAMHKLQDGTHKASGPELPQPPTMDFSDALRALKKGREVSRLVWGRGTATVIRLQFTDDHSKMTEPYLYLTSKPFKDMVPWTPNPIDLMATDWVFYGTEETGRGTGRDSTGVTQRQYDEADGFARDLNTMREGPLR